MTTDSDAIPANVEIEAFRVVAEAMDTLDPAARKRLMDWQRDRYRKDPWQFSAELVQHLVEVAQAAQAHKAATKQPSEADKALWATLLDRS